MTAPIESPLSGAQATRVACLRTAKEVLTSRSGGVLSTSTGAVTDVKAPLRVAEWILHGPPEEAAP